MRPYSIGWHAPLLGPTRGSLHWRGRAFRFGWGRRQAFYRQLAVAPLGAKLLGMRKERKHIEQHDFRASILPEAPRMVNVAPIRRAASGSSHLRGHGYN